MDNHSLNDIRRELEFAKQRDVIIIDFEVGSIYETGDVIGVTLDVGGEKVNTSINFSFRRVRYTETDPDLGYEVTHVSLDIGNWPFDEIRSVVEEHYSTSKALEE